MRFHVIDRQDDNSKLVSKRIKEDCLAQGWTEDDRRPQLLISVGGDGTLLRAIHTYSDRLDSISFVGIHTGTLGFFTDYTQDELDRFLHDLFTRSADIEAFPMLEISLPKSDRTFYAFNEARIIHMDRTLNLNLFIDGEFFEKTTGSGICVSTQYGSTAINRALSGAIVDPGIQVLQLTEIMPVTSHHHHSLRNPYIMKDDRIVQVKGEDVKHAVLGYDHCSVPLDPVDDEVRIVTSNKKVRFARYRTYSYLRRLRNLY